jgi:iron-sulfur cluster assembly accessory protein
MIDVTDAAARQLGEMLEEKGQSPDEAGLRLFVERGGCAGMSYAMRIAPPEPGDAVVEREGVRFYVAEDSRDYLSGCRLDYVEALNDAGFKIENPNAARSCGCGTSFEPAREGESPAYDPATMDGQVCGEN